MNQLLKQQAIAAVMHHDRRVADKTEIISAALGDGDGHIAIATRPGWVYVRIEGASDSVAEALCRRVDVPMVEDTTVDLRRINVMGLGYYEVIGLSAIVLYDTSPIGPGSSADANGSAAIIGQHAAQHEKYDGGRGGYDPVNVHARMFVPLRARAHSPATMKLHVDPGYNPLTGNYYAGGDSPTFTAPPAVGFSSARRYDLLYLGTDDALHITQGTPAYDTATPTLPALTSKCVPLAFVIMTNTTTGLTEATIARDGRIVVGSVVTTATPDVGIISVYTTSVDYTVAASDNLVRCNGTLALTLPAASGSGKVYHLKNIGTGVVTVNAAGGQTIDGDASKTIEFQYSSMTLCDGASGAWSIL